MLLFGFCSGLPLALSGLTLRQWLAETGVSLALIGATANVGLAYSLKFLIAPILDRPLRSGLGRRRGWLVLLQLGLIGGAICLATANPAAHPGVTLAIAGFVAFCSACQDVSIDAWRIESYPRELQGKALAASIWGYRFAMLVSGSGAIALASWLGWRGSLLAMAGLLACAPIVSLLAPEPLVHMAPRGGMAAFIDPLRDMLSRPGIWPMLAFVALFYLGEALASPMSPSFYHAMGFNRNQIAVVLGVPYLLSVLAGAAVGGLLVARFGARKSLFATGFVQMAGMAMYFLVALHPDVTWILYTKVVTENFAEAMADACFLAFLSAQCRVEFTATQYALLSSLAALALRTVGGFSGVVAAHLGWVGFYGFAIFTALPAMIIMRRYLWREPTQA